MKDLLLQNSSAEIAKELFQLAGQKAEDDVELNLDAIADVFRKNDTGRKLVATGSEESVAYVLERIGMPKAEKIDAESLLIQLVNAMAIASPKGSMAVAASRSAFSNDLESARESARKYVLQKNPGGK